MSTAPDLGKKFTCFKCDCKFYDLGAEEPLCPRCGADQREDPNPDPREAFLARFRKPSRSRSRSKKKKVEKAPEPVEQDGDSLLDDDFAEGDEADGKGSKK